MQNIVVQKPLNYVIYLLLGMFFFTVLPFICEFKTLGIFLTGLFNIGNRLLVSIDLFLKIRASIKLGQAPLQAAKTVLDHIPNHPGKH